MVRIVAVAAGLTELVVVVSAIAPAEVKTVDIMASEVVPWDVVDDADVGSSVITTVVGGTEVGVD